MGGLKGSPVEDMSDFVKEVGGYMCFRCRHLDEKYPFRCAAFQDEIPDEVWHETHTEPYPGDHGIVFDEMTEEEISERSARMSRKKELASV